MSCPRPAPRQQQLGILGILLGVEVQRLLKMDSTRVALFLDMDLDGSAQNANLNTCQYKLKPAATKHNANAPPSYIRPSRRDFRHGCKHSQKRNAAGQCSNVSGHGSGRISPEPGSQHLPTQTEAGGYKIQRKRPSKLHAESLLDRSELDPSSCQH